MHVGNVYCRNLKVCGPTRKSRVAVRCILAGLCWLIGQILQRMQNEPCEVLRVRMYWPLGACLSLLTRAHHASGPIRVNCPNGAPHEVGPSEGLQAVKDQLGIISKSNAVTERVDGEVFSNCAGPCDRLMRQSVVLFYRPMRTNRPNNMEHAAGPCEGLRTRACELLWGNLGSSSMEDCSHHGIMRANCLNVTHMKWAHAIVS